jgi:RHS repeat-associated protein
VNPWDDSVTHATEAEATYQYDAAGNLRSVLYKNGIETRYAYNSRNQLRRVRTGTVGNWDNSAVAALANFDYDETGSAPIAAAGGDPGTRRLSLSGQRNRMAERLDGNLRTVDYDYDKLRRLTLEAIGSTTINYAGNGTVLGYDAVGNRRSRISTVSAVASTPTTSNVNYDVNDQIDNDGAPTTLSSRFDANGNTIVPDFNGNGVIDTADTGYTYTYNLENQLITANGGGKNITLNYDADGNRVRKVVGASTTYYLVDEQNPTGYAQVLEERSAPNASPSVIYTYGLDLVNQDRGGNVHYYGYDGLGSVRFLTHSGGGISDTYTYDAFGIQTASVSPTLNHYRFTGEQWDADLQMYYLRARYYAPGLGSFWTMDSYEGAQNDPLSLHKYLYCAANPINRIDPSGNESLISLMGGLTPRLLIAANHVYRLYILKQRIETSIGLIQLLPEATQVAMDIHQKGLDGLDEESFNRIEGLGTSVALVAVGSLGGKGMKILGDKLRDKLGAVFKRVGFDVEFEVPKNTPYGTRKIDVEIRFRGKALGFETKLGTSRYGGDQKLKDEWLWKVKRYRVIVVRGTHEDIKD